VTEQFDGDGFPALRVIARFGKAIMHQSSATDMGQRFGG
jgi:hypothetical protein